MSLAGNLEGKLMIAYGELDENADPAFMRQMIDALVKHHKDFDLMLLPNTAHTGISTYYTRRFWDYFVEHLMGAEPPAGYRIKDPAPD